MKVSFIATVYNEELTIHDLLVSLFTQSKTPDEIIIVDGGSSDRTVAEIKNQISKIKNKKEFKDIRFKTIVKSGNRSVGRNQAIKNSTGDIILCSDAGNILDKRWVENIVKSFKDPSVDVVAGYYKGKSNTIFEKCLIPYVLVMEDRVDPDNFLPATRSMGFRRTIWKKVGKFPEEFSNNEDYVFAKKLKDINARIVFEKRAIVYWKPRKNLKEAFIMFYRFAKGDSEARIFRPKVILIFVRYIVFFIFLAMFFVFKLYLILNTLYFILFLYGLWSIKKNLKYVNDIRTVFFLPLLQFTSDIAVVLGTTSALLTFRLKVLIEGIFYISVVYLTILLSFRQLRSLFKPPQVTEDGIIGYAQYFGYPLYFETIIFFVFILSPIVIFFILSLVRKYKE